MKQKKCLILIGITLVTLLTLFCHEFALSFEKVNRPNVLINESNVITAVAFSCDNKYVAVGGWDKVIGIYNAKSGKLEKQLKGHDGGITSLQFSPDFNHIA